VADLGGELKTAAKDKLGDILARQGPGWLPGPFQTAARSSPHAREFFNRLGDVLTIGSEWSDAADMRDLVQGSQGLSRAIAEGDLEGGLESGAQTLGGLGGVAGGPLVSSAAIKLPLLGAITAFHGSPHKFKKFKLDETTIGTGEGAQAYGHGLYFAGGEGTGKFYQTALSRQGVDRTPVTFTNLRGAAEAGVDRISIAKKMAGEMPSGTPDMGVPYYPMAHAIGRLQEGASLDDAITSMVEQYPQFSPGAITRAKKALVASKPEASLGGALYKVDLKVEPEDMLDWDKPASQMPDAVVDKLADLAAQHGLRMGDASGARFYQELSAQIGTVNASQALHDAGIPGMRVRA